MARKTEFIIDKVGTVLEHRSLGPQSEAAPASPGLLEHRKLEHRNLEEHRILRPLEHRSLGGAMEHRHLDALPEHRNFEHRSLAGEASNPVVLGEATCELSQPQSVSSVTVQRRSDGTFFLVLNE